MVTRGGDPALMMTKDEPWELIPPRFERGASEGSGDSMVGALAAALARGLASRRRCGGAPPRAPPTSCGTGSAPVRATWSSDLFPRVELRPLKRLDQRRGPGRA